MVERAATASAAPLAGRAPTAFWPTWSAAPARRRAAGSTCLKGRGAAPAGTTGATRSATEAATAYARARGGAGGRGGGAGFSGGAGGVATIGIAMIAPVVTASGHSTYARAYQFGGRGGYGINGAD